MSRIQIVGALVVVSALTWTPMAAAQTAAAGSQEVGIAGTWLVTVEGESNTRTLVISDAAPSDSGALPAAKYGMSGGKLPPVDAKLLRSGDKRQLNIVTQASSVIATAEQADGSFKGTFTTKAGTIKSVVIARVPDGALPQAAAHADPAAPVPLAAGIPEDCAALHGNWSGTWNQGGYGELFLRVVDAAYADGKCTLRFSYSGSKTAVPARLTAQASAGNFSFVCNRSAGGTCVFKRNGSDLWGSYSDASGGANSGVFRKASN